MTDPAREPLPEEVALSGGVANAGAVVRVRDEQFGDTVRRPRGPHTETVHAFLRHLRERGVPEVVEPLGFDERGREVVRFVEADQPSGAAAAWDFPPVRDDHSILLAIADVQRRMHEAAVDFEPDPNTAWSGDHYFPTGADGGLVCHNDLCISNVLQREGTVVGIIDFDYARPVNRLFDIAVAIRHWLPIMAVADCPVDRADLMANLDRPARFAAYCEALRLDGVERNEVLDLAHGFLLHAKDNVARLAAAGVGGFAAMMANGYAERNDRTVAWLDGERAALLAG